MSEEPDIDEYVDDDSDIFEGACEACSGTGQQYEGDVVVGNCLVCGGSG